MKHLIKKLKLKYKVFLQNRKNGTIIPVYDNHGQLKRVYKKVNFLFFRFSCRMPTVYGINNKLILVNDGVEEIVSDFENGIYIYIDGNNNTVKLDKNSIYPNCKIIISGNENEVIIEKPQRMFGVYVQMDKKANNRKLIIKKDCYCWSGLYSFSSDNNISILVGEDCMFSSGVTVRATDGHKIHDINTGTRINFDKSVEIGDHVWIMQDAKILKGVKVLSGCIIGANSVVTKSIDCENAIIAGSPAKIIKKDIYWSK